MKNPQALSLCAISQLYTEHHRWLVQWLYRHLGCPHHAADLAQDTFTRLLTARERLYIDEAKALLTVVAKGLVIDYFRKSALEQAFQEALSQLPEAVMPSPEAQAMAMEAVVAVDSMLAQLPSKVRQAFLLSRIDGLSYGEIAEQLDVSVNSVQQYMIRAYGACYAAAFPT